MSDAPERIWVAPWREGDWSEGEGDWDDNEGKTLNDKPCIQYVRADRIESLTEQLEAARADAKEAEAYAEGLEKEIELNEQEACMVENDLIKADKEIDDLKAKLAKAMRALERAKASIESGGGGGVTDVVWLDDPCPETLCDFIDATLAEIKGGKG
jgi:hypothetical protein